MTLDNSSDLFRKYQSSFLNYLTSLDYIDCDVVIDKGKDIKIEFTGLRPGEKLYEELLMNEEGLQSTDNELIHIGKPIDVDEDVLFSKLDELRDICHGEKGGVYDVVHELVPTFTGHPQEQ